MIKYRLLITACCCCIACGQPADKLATLKEMQVSPDSLINPGIGIGNIHLNQDAAQVINHLGQPDKADAAMGASLMTWYARHDTSGYRITVYAHRNMGARDEAISHIKQIRVTVPSYQTSQRVHAGSLLDSIKRHYTLSSDQQNGVYDDVKAGIAFEISGENVRLLLFMPRAIVRLRILI